MRLLARHEGAEAGARLLNLVETLQDQDHLTFVVMGLGRRRTAEAVPALLGLVVSVIVYLLAVFAGLGPKRA